MHLCRAFALGLSAFDDQHHTRAEQKREKSTHFAVDENEREYPGNLVFGRQPSISHRRDISPFGHGKSDDVHRQYSHHREPSHGIKCKMSV